MVCYTEWGGYNIVESVHWAKDTQPTMERDEATYLKSDKRI